MITQQQLARCIIEADRFVVYAHAALNRIHAVNPHEAEYPLVTGVKETAAVRRASMDLSRALSDLRRSR